MSVLRYSVHPCRWDVTKYVKGNSEYKCISVLSHKWYIGKPETSMIQSKEITEKAYSTKCFKNLYVYVMA